MLGSHEVGLYGGVLFADGLPAGCLRRLCFVAVRGSVEQLDLALVVRLVECGFKQLDYFTYIGVPLLEFVVVAPALEGIASRDEAGHFLVKLVGAR